ncbi:MAG: hypothetical protein L0G22_09580 [Propionibacteriaceae bacterium]|nr:hypothetical protein [Propionibacteriaceae bacterium]
MVRLLDLLAAERVVAILRGSSAAHACRAAEVIAGAGVRLLEVSLTTPDALAAIAELTASLPPGSSVPPLSPESWLEPSGSLGSSAKAGAAPSPPKTTVTARTPATASERRAGSVMVPSIR